MLYDWNSRTPGLLLGYMPTTFTAEAYRNEAERARQLAYTAASEVTRAQLLDLAQQYEDLATRAELDNAAPDER
jgi:hypothetical protein